MACTLPVSDEAGGRRSRSSESASMEGLEVTTKANLYSAVDEEITHYEVDVEAATLTRRGSIRVPSFVQYAWPHPSLRYLYVTSSNRGPGLKADCNHVTALRIDPASGALAAHGDPVSLRQRAVHMCLDPAGDYAVNIHNVPVPRITIHRIAADGRIAEQVPQLDGLDYGIYPHQVRVTPSGRSVIDVVRGNSAAHG